MFADMFSREPKECCILVRLCSQSLTLRPTYVEKQQQRTYHNVVAQWVVTQKKEHSYNLFGVSEIVANSFTEA